MIDVHPDDVELAARRCASYVLKYTDATPSQIRELAEVVEEAVKDWISEVNADEELSADEAREASMNHGSDHDDRAALRDAGRGHLVR